MDICVLLDLTKMGEILLGLVHMYLYLDIMQFLMQAGRGRLYLKSTYICIRLKLIKIGLCTPIG